MKKNILTIYKEEQNKIRKPISKSLGLLLISIVVIVLTNTLALEGIKAIINFNNDVNVLVEDYSYIDPLLSFIPLFVIIFYQKIINKHSFSAIGLNKNKAIKNYLIGLLIGSLMLSIIIIVGYYLEILNIKQNIYNYTLIAIYFIAFTIQGISKQMFYTNFIFSEINAKYNVYLGIIITGMIYALVNINNTSFNYIAFINIFLFGILYCAIYYHTQSIWFTSALYTAFKFAEGNIFGLAISKIVNYESTLTTTLESDIFLTGGAFGIKASILTTPIVLLALIITILMIKKERNKHGINNK